MKLSFKLIGAAVLLHATAGFAQTPAITTATQRIALLQQELALAAKDPILAKRYAAVVAQLQQELKTEQATLASLQKAAAQEAAAKAAAQAAAAKAAAEAAAKAAAAKAAAQAAAQAAAAKAAAQAAAQAAAAKAAAQAAAQAAAAKAAAQAAAQAAAAKAAAQAAAQAAATKAAAEAAAAAAAKAAATTTTTAASTTSAASSTVALATAIITSGTNGALNGFVPRIVDDLYTDISTKAVDAYNATFMGSYGTNGLHPDFTIPYTVVSHATSVIPSSVETADESDVLPIPLNASDAIENGAQGCTSDGADHHAIMIDNSTGWDYEVYQATYCNGKWSAYSTTLWDMTGTQQRPYGWTSGDAAGLPIFPLLVRYDEVAGGAINHALRVTINHTKTGANGGIFVAPATHASGDLWGTAAYTGMRFRLKANFDISGYSAENQVILKAMKKYGMIVADNGSSGYFQGTADSRWNFDDLNKLKNVKLNDFEIVEMGTQEAVNVAPKGNAPTISSFTEQTVNGSTTFSWSTTDASYNYIQELGPVRGSSYAAGSVHGTFTLVSTNLYGRTTKTVKVP